MAFHVNYWNDLGWKDTFSAEQYSQRQRAYSREHKKKVVFTPQLLINGSERSWQRFQNLPNILKFKGNTGSLKATVSKKKTVHIRFTPPQNRLKRPQKFLAFSAFVGFEMITKPLRGENKGRTIKQDFVVLSFQKSPLNLVKKNLYSVTQNHTKDLKKHKKLALIVWVSKEGSLKPLQITGGYTSWGK